MTDPGPEVDGRHPADVVPAMVNHVLELAATWPRWDGKPVEGDAWTLRQVAFHVTESAFYADSVGAIRS